MSTAAFALLPGLPSFDPRDHLDIAERATELGVLVALLGAGLSIDRRPGARSWMTTWRLLALAMPLTIAGVAVVAWSFWGLAPAAALLFGAVIAPTDPVLAADVQVGEPAVEGAPADAEDEVRFSLTSEAGLNDGLAFPFVWAAIAASASTSRSWITEWALSDLLARVVIGVVVGWLVGNLLSRIVFNPPARLTALADSTQGFVALGATLFAYGIAELAHGYGFLAVFVAAVALRDSKREHTYHRVLHHFSGEIEQLLSVGLLIMFGAAIASGLLSDLTWRGAVVGVMTIFLVRPMAARVSLVRTDTTHSERRAIEFFGIRGIGSLYYLAFATRQTTFAASDELWSTVAFTILLSIFVHGVTATPVMRSLDRRRARRNQRTRPRRSLRA
jgi:NhaP-type Na+/H+ or K+/H+ antiporter